MTTEIDKFAALTALGDVLTADTPLDRHRPKGRDADRLEIRFDVETATVYPAVKRLRNPLKNAVLLRYVEQPSLTPTGGRYIARRLLVQTVNPKTRELRRWVGTMKKDTDVVRLRPEPKGK